MNRMRFPQLELEHFILSGLSFLLDFLIGNEFSFIDLDVVWLLAGGERDPTHTHTHLAGSSAPGTVRYTSVHLAGLPRSSE